MLQDGSQQSAVRNKFYPIDKPVYYSFRSFSPSPETCNTGQILLGDLPWADC